MLKAINIQKFYGKLQVLKGVDLEIAKSEIVSIEDIWPDYPSQDDFFFNEDEY